MINRRLLFIIITLFLSQMSVYAQNFLKGKVLNKEAIPIVDAMVEIDSKRQFTNDKGIFKFTQKAIVSGKLPINIFRTGYQSLRDTITLSKNTILQMQYLGKVLEVTLKRDPNYNLDEVTVKGSATTVKASGVTHRINSEKYAEDTKATEVLGTLPNVYATKDEVIVDGRKNALVFIDGMEAMRGELENLNVDELESVEVISNPSAFYELGASSAVVKIITKKKKERFIKGALRGSADIRLDGNNILPPLFSIAPSFSFKTENITFKSNLSVLQNTQYQKLNRERKYNTEVFNNNSNGQIRYTQFNLGSKMKMILTPKSYLNLNLSIFGYGYNGEDFGSYTQKNIKTDIKENDNFKMRKIFGSAIYGYDFNPKSKLFIKYKYRDYLDESDFTRYEGKDKRKYVGNLSSNMKESSFALVYQNKKVKLLGVPLEYSLNYKNIFRKQTLDQKELNQYINIVDVDSDIKFTDKFSMYGSLAFDYFQNSDITPPQNNGSFLPTFSAVYKFTNHTNLRVQYSKRVNRPSAEQLNSNDYVNVAHVIRGNMNLKPQIKDSYELSLSTSIDQTFLYFGVYYQRTPNAIIQTIHEDGNRMIKTYENTGKVQLYGAHMSINARLFNTVFLNFFPSIQYNNYHTTSNNSLVKENTGFSYRLMLMLLVPIKKIFTLSINGHYNSNDYSLISKSSNVPILGVSARKTFFSSKLEIGLYYYGLFSSFMDSKTEVSYNNFSEIITSSNNSHAISLSITYNFGKSFDDSIDDIDISNDDIQLKQK